MGRVLDRSLPRFRSFAARHGYDVIVGSGASADRPAPWGKILLLQNLLKHYDTVLWVDADVLIVDESEDLPPLPADRFQALVEQRASGAVANTGVWLLRAGPDADAFLEQVWQAPSGVSHRWWEQASVMSLLGYVDMPDAPGDPSVSRHAERTPWYDGTHFLGSEWNGLYAPYLRDHEAPRFWHFAAMDNWERVVSMEIEARRGAGGAAAATRVALEAGRGLRRLRKRLTA
jgi:hypothetical protein